jgi:polysaccharide export outer membrane protein
MFSLNTFLKSNKAHFLLLLAVYSAITSPSLAQQLAATSVVAPWMDDNAQILPPIPNDEEDILNPRPLTIQDLEKLGHRAGVKTTAINATPLELMYANRLDNELELFGYDLFHSKKKRDGEIPAGMVQDNYLLSSGDKLEIIFRGQENARKAFSVNSQGLLITDTLAPMTVTGRTLGDVRKSMEEDAARLHNLQIHVSLAEARQIDVLVIGDVVEPGRKTLSAFHSALDALQQAGGIKKTGTLRRIKLVRSGKSQFIDLYNVMMQGGEAADIRLQDGDRLIVPPIGATVAVAGAVKRPAIYEIKRGENLSALEMLGLAGGVLAPGSNRFMRLSLTNNGDEIVEDIDEPSKRIFSDGSILNVAQASAKRSRNVTLSGATRDPGEHDMKKAKSLSELIGKQNALGDTIYPLIGVIERKDPKTLTKSLVEFSPRQVLQNKYNAELTEGDVVHLFTIEQIHKLGGKISDEPLLKKASITAGEKADSAKIKDAYIVSFLQERAAFIRGAVRQPGAYPVAKDTTLETLLAVAGGATIEANTDNIEVTTRLIPADQTTDAMQPSRKTVSLSSLDGKTISVAPGDTVRVNQKFNRVAEQSVTLLGEVKNPGKYDLLPGDTMMSLLQRAGGITNIAYPDGAIFSRASERKQEESRYKAAARDLEMQLASALRQQENDKNKKPDITQINTTQGLITQLREAEAVGRITIEADPDVLSRDPDQDILLEAGDKIYIPRRPLNVRVGGEVLSPAALQFRKGTAARDYINGAGGPTYYADMDRAFVVYPDGSAQPLSVSAWRQSITMIPPGSTIIVPRDPKPFDFLESAEKISTILANIALTGFYIDDLGDDN